MIDQQISYMYAASICVTCWSTLLSIEEAEAASVCHCLLFRIVSSDLMRRCLPT
jgi:hypothetical protein